MTKVLIETEDWISLAEAARLRGISRQAVSKLVNRGRIPCLRISNTVFVQRAAIHCFTELPPGRKCGKKGNT
jgi:hypothetical protein